MFHHSVEQFEALLEVYAWVGVFFKMLVVEGYADAVQS